MERQFSLLGEQKTGWTKLETKSKPRTRSGASYALRLARYGGDKILSVTLSEKMIKRLKWKLGDRVHFIIDEKGEMFGLQRTTDLSGKTVTHNSAKKSCRQAVVRITCPDSKTLDKICIPKQPRVFDIADVLIDDGEDILAIELLKDPNK